MSRTRDLIKFTWLIALATLVTVTVLSVVDLPSTRVQAQQAAASLQPSDPPVTPPQPVVDLGNAFAEVAAVVKPAIVYIVAEQRAQEEQTQDTPETPFDQFFRFDPREQQRRPERGTGTGFIISPDGYILTNNHVVEGFDRFDVTLENGRQHKATVVGGDALTDVAVIKINETEMSR